MPKETVSTGDTVETPPGTPPEPKATPPAGDTTGTDAESRIKGLIAERDRKDAAIKKMQGEYDALVEKNKSEEEKRIDELVQQRVDQEYGPVKQRLESITADLEARRAQLLAQLPEDAQECYDKNASVETQVKQIEIVAGHLLNNKTAAPGRVDSSGNPPATEKKPFYTRAEFDRVARLAGSYDEADKEEYKKKWPELKAARMEGRIKD